MIVQAALQGTNFYESYTGVELPLKKLDMMGIPGKGGAVENWGLIQFDERRMLVNDVYIFLSCIICAVTTVLIMGIVGYPSNEGAIENCGPAQYDKSCMSVPDTSMFISGVATRPASNPR